MENKEALFKVFAWRLGVSIPLSTIVTWLYYGELDRAVLFVIVINALMIFAHFIFEKVWPFFWKRVVSKDKKD